MRFFNFCKNYSGSLKYIRVTISEFIKKHKEKEKWQEHIRLI